MFLLAPCSEPVRANQHPFYKEHIFEFGRAIKYILEEDHKIPRFMTKDVLFMYRKNKNPDRTHA